MKFTGDFEKELESATEHGELYALLLNGMKAEFFKLRNQLAFDILDLTTKLEKSKSDSEWKETYELRIEMARKELAELTRNREVAEVVIGIIMMPHMRKILVEKQKLLQE